MPYAPVRYTLKHQADAWQRYFKGQGGRPRFRKRGNDSVTLPQDVRIEAERLYLPKLGWMRLSRRGGNPYLPTICASPATRLHPLTGKLAGHWSIRVPGNWRLVFRFEGSGAVDVDLVDYH